MKSDIKKKTVEELFALLYDAMEYDRAPKSYGTDVLISSSEIYMVKCIFDTEKASVTNISKTLDITKSAVSQAVKKLKSKDLINISIDEDNLSRYVIDLTEKGNTAHENHINARAELSSKIYSLLDSCTEDSIEALYDFISGSRKELLTTLEKE